MTDEEAVRVAKGRVEDLNSMLREMARRGIKVELEVRSLNYLGTGMGEEGTLVEAKFLRSL